MDESWNELPLYLSVKDIEQLGFKKATIYRWFNAESFPAMIRTGGMRVNKFKLKEWLEKQEDTIHEK